MKVHMHVPPAHNLPDREALKSATVELEATFLAEMLRSGGLGKSSGALGGGVGEEQFSSMLVMQQARQIARTGGIGLSEILFRSILEQAYEE